MKKLVILAGGKGTRLQGIADHIPKPMVRIGGKPVLEHQIELARRYGITDITIVTGYLSECIEEYFGNGNRWGVTISYFREPFPLGTAGGLKFLENELTEDFLVFYGDTIMDIDIPSFLTFHNSMNGIATLMVHPNDHPFDSDLLDMDGTHQITAFYPKPHEANVYHRNLVNAALYVLTPTILKYIQQGVPSDFGKDIFPRALVQQESLFGYLSAEYVKDMGTPERLKKVEHAFLSGKVQRLNRRYPQKAIFLDRDGVINKDVHFLSHPDEFELLPDVTKAIRTINLSEYLTIVITNQPVIARGECSIPTLQEIHKKMDTLLGKEGAYIDRLYYCPHHPDRGFPGERPEYKIPCNCRKPAPGMIQQAAKDYHIDLSQSLIIGDSTTDIQTGRNIDLRTLLLKTGYGGQDRKYEVTPDDVFNTLYEAVQFIVGE